jgi:DNA-binding NarL/FixJ family response regulator
MTAAYQDNPALECAGGEDNQEPDRIRVVVADDSENAMRAICALIELEPQVEVIGRARDGVEAIVAVAKLNPDLIVMDVNMPCLDGLKTAAILSAHFPELRIVLMSAADDPELKTQGRLHGADTFVPKHELIHGLTAAIRELYSWVT